MPPAGWSWRSSPTVGSSRWPDDAVVVVLFNRASLITFEVGIELEHDETMSNESARRPTASARPLDEPLPNRRIERYDGGGVSVTLADFSDENRRIVERVYAFVEAIERRLREPVLDGGDSVGALGEALAELNWREVGRAVGMLTSRRESGEGAQERARALHDIRGGAWTGLWGLLQFAASVEMSAADAQEAFLLARDHAKMMRNAVSDIDPERSRRDRAVKLHGVDLLVDKWQAGGSREGEVLDVDVHCEYRGSIAERCLEFSALDRVLYNLLNNASRHSADKTADLWMLPSPTDTPRDVRFVVQNPVTEEDRARLEELEEKGESLFSPGVSSTGSGLGLAIAAEFVANAYGLEGPESAAENGHVGVQREDGRVSIWVHWPIVD